MSWLSQLFVGKKKKEFITHKHSDIMDFVKKEINMVKTKGRIWMPDSERAEITWDEMNKAVFTYNRIKAKYQTDFQQYTPELRDCDDYGDSLDGVIKIMYGSRLCGKIIYWKGNTLHEANFFIEWNNKKIWVIEPQTLVWDEYKYSDRVEWLKF